MDSWIGLSKGLVEKNSAKELVKVINYEKAKFYITEKTNNNILVIQK